MATVLAAGILFEAVKARFTAESPSVSVVFGWREPPKQINAGGIANRVCFVPGLDGKAGEYGAVRRPGQNPRNLRTLREFIEVRVWACDTADIESEYAQWTACRLLHDAVIRAIELCVRSKATPNLELEYSEPEWIRPELERHLGAELRFAVALPSAIVDSALAEQSNVEGQIGTYMGNTLDSTDVITGA